ncbi:MAG: glycosyltransferase [Prolixibacteraceae bacterium]
MRVLMFGWEFPPHISGGLGTACYGLTKSMAGFDDVEVTFVVPKSWGDESTSEISLIGANNYQVVSEEIRFADVDSKIEYYELKSGLIPYLGTAEYYELASKPSSAEQELIETTAEGKVLFTGDYGQNLFSEIRSFALVAEKMAEEKEFDVIHVHDWMTFPAGMTVKGISGRPLVVHVHSTEFDRTGGNINLDIFSIEKQGMDAADKIVAVSNATRQLIISKYDVDPEKVITVYNGVEAKKNAEQKISERNGEKIVSFLGRVTIQKGPEYFLRAAELVLRKLDHVQFVMAGKGDLLNDMVILAEKLNIRDRIRFTGFLPDEKVDELFRSSDVFVMPSVSEPFGIVALEAMQFGVPTIVSKQSGVAEILKNVITCDYWDTATLADAVYTLLSSPEFSRKMGILGQLETKKMRWEIPAEKLLKIYSQLISV